jgi:glutathione synthase
MAESLGSLVEHFRKEFLEGSEDAKADFTADIESWARVHGLVMGNGAPTPFTLVSHPIRREVFKQAMESGPLFGKLVHAVSKDVDYVNWVLRSVTDPFTVQLLSILNSVAKEGIRQKYAMGIHRSDYMIHEGRTLQQIEINTISSAFGALTHCMADLHAHLIRNWASVRDGVFNPASVDSALLERAVLANESLESIVALFDAAMTAYCTSAKVERSERVAVLMIVQPGERNSIDQRWLQYRMESRFGLHVLRHSLKYVHEHATLDAESGKLTMDGYEVAIAYYRAGYTPTDYPSDAEWAARLLIERSLAIKCPNIAYHLAGTKKMQQVLALPNQLEKFISEEADILALRACFAGLYSLTQEEDPQVDVTIARAIEHPHNYVMKPQREGGGHLLTNEAMVHALRTMSPIERADYILMQRIEPQAHRTILFRDGQFSIANCIAELGVFCLVLDNYAQPNNLQINKTGGWLLRSKPDNVEDGGVAAGRAYLDSPHLF